jgi:hypothetical protein
MYLQENKYFKKQPLPHLQIPSGKKERAVDYLY